jgi:hypothetical protein
MCDLLGYRGRRGLDRTPNTISHGRTDEVHSILVVVYIVKLSVRPDTVRPLGRYHRLIELSSV